MLTDKSFFPAFFPLPFSLSDLVFHNIPIQLDNGQIALIDIISMGGSNLIGITKDITPGRQITLNLNRSLILDIARNLDKCTIFN